MDLKPTFNIRLILNVVSSNMMYILETTRELNDNPEKIIRSSFMWLVDKNQLNINRDIYVMKPEIRDKVSYAIVCENGGNGIEMGERDLRIEIDCKITKNYFIQFTDRIRREKLSSILSTEFIQGDIMIEAIQVVGDNPPSYKIYGTTTELMD